MIVYGFDANICKRVFRKLERFVFHFGSSSYIWGYAVVGTTAGLNLYPYT